MSVGNKITKAQRWAHAVCQRSKFCLRYLLNTAPQLPVYAVVDEDVVSALGGSWCSYSQWFGELNRACNDAVWNGTEKTWRRSEARKDPEDIFVAEATDAALKAADAMDDDEKRRYIWDWVESCPWNECVLLYIGTPDTL